MKDCDRHIISINASIREGLSRLNSLSGGIMTLFVTDGDDVMRGALTDGDIRRALIAGASLDTKVGDVMQRDFKAVRGDTPDVARLKELREHGIRLVPHLDGNGRILGVIDLSDGRTRLPVSAVLMAGGLGERLRPLTNDTPKPLLEIGGKAIIDYNIEALAACDVTDIWVSVRYLAEKIRHHFAELVAGVQVRCVTEDKPLGTIGSAALASLPADGYTIVMNSDLLTNISFEDMYLHHVATASDITMAVIPYQVSVPFAIVETGADGRVTSLSEKPVYSYFANAGIYIFPNKMLSSLPLDSPTDAPDLVQKAIDSGLKVTEFPINGTWIDIGSPADFHQASELMKYHRSIPGAR